MEGATSRGWEAEETSLLSEFWTRAGDDRDSLFI
jgi:hypothetical protein